MKGNLLCLRTKVEPLNFVGKSATKKRENQNARKKLRFPANNNKPNLVLGGLGGFN